MRTRLRWLCGEAEGTASTSPFTSVSYFRVPASVPGDFSLAQSVRGLLLRTSHCDTWWLKMTVLSVQICHLDGAQRAQVPSLRVVATVPKGEPAACDSVLHPVVLTRIRGPSRP